MSNSIILCSKNQKYHQLFHRVLKYSAINLKRCGKVGHHIFLMVSSLCWGSVELFWQTFSWSKFLKKSHLTVDVDRLFEPQFHEVLYQVKLDCIQSLQFRLFSSLCTVDIISWTFYSKLKTEHTSHLMHTFGVWHTFVCRHNT